MPRRKPPNAAPGPLPLVQLLARGVPAGYYDVRQIPLSLRNVEDLLHERGIDICHETVRLWWRRFGPMFANKKRGEAMRQHTHWRWRLDEVNAKINGERCYLWRAVDHEGDV